MNDQTRRDWVFTIGQAAVGFGVAGLVQGEPANAYTLPPGVYLPSTDDLSHALMSAERYHPIPTGCPTDYVRPRNGPFTPFFFSAAELAVILRLTELLLGEVSVSQEVAEWVDLHLSSLAAVREAEARVEPIYRALAAAYLGPAEDHTVNSGRICREGLAWLLSDSKEFMSLGEDDQIAILRSISDERTEKVTENAGTRFFSFLKAEVIRGFYTSRAGLQELDFKGNAFYARSPGCPSK